MEIANFTKGGCAARTVPAQVHIALASSGGVDAPFDGMAVSWSTGLPAESPTLFWSLTAGVKAGGSGVTAVAAERTSHLLANYHHHAVVTLLPPGTRVFYKLGDNNVASSKEWSFKTAPADNTPFSVSIFADLAYGSDGNAVDSRMRLEALKDKQAFDFAWHLGDIAYADDAFLHLHR
jgi:hypothetical protein